MSKESIINSISIHPPTQKVLYASNLKDDHKMGI